MLDPRAVATLGIGFGAGLVARIGLWAEEITSVGGGDDSHVDLVKLRQGIRRAQEERGRLEAERLAEIEREASEVLARIAKAKEPEPYEPVVIPIPEAIDHEPTNNDYFSVQLAPVNGIVAANSLPTYEQISTYRQQHVQKTGKYIHDEDEALALIMILAEID